MTDEKSDDLKLRLNDHKSDIVCLTETWFTDVREKKTQFPGYKLFSAKRQNRVGGGVAILVNSQIHATILESQSTKTWSALWLMIKHPDIQSMIIGCVYHPPSDNSSENLERIENTLNQLTIKHPKAKILVSGDFNHMPLDELTVQFNLCKKIDFTTRGDAIQDQILTDVDDYRSPLCLPPLLGNETDHCCVHLPLQNITKHKYKVMISRGWNTRTRNDILLDLALQEWSHASEIQDVYEMVDRYHKTITTILDGHCPIKRRKVRTDNSFTMTTLIDKLKKARDRAHKNNKKSLTWVYLSKLVARLVRKANRQYASKKLNTAVSSCTWWREIDKIDGKTQPELPNYHKLNEDWLTTREMTEELNKYFSKVGGTQDTLISSCANLPTALPPVSYGEIKQLLKCLNSQKATHSNDTPTWVTKTAAEDLCVPVTHIINKMLQQQKYPALWKNAEIRPLKKTSGAQTPGDYRPIALLYHLGKVAEDVILDKLKSCIETKLDKNQYAYRQQHSTTDALLKLVNNWCAALDDTKTSHVSVAMIDMSKAFDRMHPNLLVEKLQQFDVQDSLSQLINNFLTNRTCSVKLGNEASTSEHISMGTPQGTKLGPWLWLAYINNLNPPTTTVKFADDVTTYNIIRKSTANSDLQTSLDYIAEWASNNNMLLNTKKTQLLKLTLTTPKQPDSYQLNNTAIDTSSVSKLLGVSIDSRLSFSAHVDDIVSRTSYKLYTMRRLRRLGAAEKCLMTFYKAHILSVITYASPAWSSLITDGSMKQLEQIQRKALKIISPDQSYNENLVSLCLPQIELLLDDKNRSYYKTIANNDNHPLKNVIVPNSCTRSLRVNRMSSTPVCRTSKYQSSFFIKYAF